MENNKKMRIISGSLKGKSINFLKNLNTRPLKDIVKENTFNILEHSNLIDVQIKGSNVLDLYSGIGSFGIECISRGAKKVTFIEKEISAATVLKDNLINLSISQKSIVYNENIDFFLNKKLKDKFDIFFFDPPYADKDFKKNLEIIKKKNLYKKNNIIIIHREKKSNDVLQKFIRIINIKEYGRSKIIFGSIS